MAWEQLRPRLPCRGLECGHRLLPGFWRLPARRPSSLCSPRPTSWSRPPGRPRSPRSLSRSRPRIRVSWRPPRRLCSSPSPRLVSWRPAHTRAGRCPPRRWRSTSPSTRRRAASGARPAPSAAGSAWTARGTRSCRATAASSASSAGQQSVIRPWRPKTRGSCGVLWTPSSSGLPTRPVSRPRSASICSWRGCWLGASRGPCRRGCWSWPGP
mmetsp:Transcript_63743/g.189952  ORF Transcript_63743/g.189952 Transcript_63743/m.189952 type:complete len:212 (+) Transcript_63743:180-815(+)